MSGWQYLPFWWNCHDFAIRLAYLMVTDNGDESQGSKNLLAHFLVQIKRSMILLVRKAIRVGNMAIVSCFAGIAILGSIFPPALPGSAALFTTWCVTLFGVQKMQDIVMEGTSEFEEYNKKLQQCFPSLGKLHEKLRTGLSKMINEHSSVAKTDTTSRSVPGSRSRAKNLKSRISKPKQKTWVSAQCTSTARHPQIIRGGRHHDHAS